MIVSYWRAAITDETRADVLADAVARLTAIGQETPDVPLTLTIQESPDVDATFRIHSYLPRKGLPSVQTKIYEAWRGKVTSLAGIR